MFIIKNPCRLIKSAGDGLVLLGARCLPLVAIGSEKKVGILGAGLMRDTVV